MARLLVVDDDANIRFLLQEELTLAGHSVRCAADGLAGLDAAEQEHPDLVILDLKMPGMGGLEVLRRLKQTQPSLPVLLFTAYGDFHDEARSLGADGYLVKSYDFSALADTVQKFLDRPGDDRGPC
jgi:two-component system response regulator (stage 0 sporulation protein F)